MLTNPHSARNMHQHKMLYPTHSWHKTCRLSNYLTDHLEELTKNVHAAWISLSFRDLIQPIPNHIMGKTHIHCTATHRSHHTEDQLKCCYFKWKHKYLKEFLCSRHAKIRNFCLSKSWRTVCNSKEKFGITKYMREEINLLYSMETSPIVFLWETPFSHLISID